MNRRTALQGIVVFSVGYGTRDSLAAVPLAAPLIKLVGKGILAIAKHLKAPPASAIAGTITRQTVTRYAIVNGVRTAVQTVTTTQIGITVAGITAVSLTAAKLIWDYQCQGIIVRGTPDPIAVQTSGLTRPSHIQVDIIDAQNDRQNGYVREYANTGVSEFNVRLDRDIYPGVKRFVARAEDDDRIQPARSPNILYAAEHDVFA